jgi:uncharacterized protein (DUF2147 family)
MYKMNVKLLVIAAFLIFCNVKLFAQSGADKILGTWYTENKRAKIEIYKKDGKYHGKIIELKEPIDPDTKKPKTDKNNPDASQRNVPLIGLNLIKNFVYRNGYWQDGTIYDPENGKEYSCYMEFEDPNNPKKLKVRGYIGFSWIGRTTYWTRD